MFTDRLLHTLLCFDLGKNVTADSFQKKPKCSDHGDPF